MEDKIYTIGYSGFDIDTFIRRLKSYGITALIDVRSTPYSKYFHDYDKENLAEKLKKERVVYRNYAQEFGARQNNIFYYPNGYLDFNRFASSSSFLSGKEKIINAMDKGYKFALMCSEKDPLTCHRAILVSREFYKSGLDVIHILPDDKECTQQDIEQRLLEMYFPDNENQNSQPDLFEDKRSKDELIDEAYSRQNEKIGFRIGDTG